MSDLGNFFSHCTKIVDARLDDLIPSAGTAPARLYEAVRWSVFAGGKRFRPTLLLAVGTAFGCAEEKLLSAACGVEMIHTYSLIHDDLPAMDDDDLRRGRATAHVKFDEATAILAGDVLQALAFESIAADESLPAKTRVRVIAELANSAARMVDGQQLDLDGEGRKITLAELEKTHQNKTGALVCFAARGGALIAEASENELNAVSNYAAKLGLLFQITDDLLDVTQTTEILGKTAGKDERAEKATYPAFYGIEGTQKLAEKVYAEALSELNGIEKPTGILREIAGFILSRKS